MATRTVTTVFAVEGESAYKTAVKNINAEIKNLNSVMQLSEERYKGNESSMEALSAKLGNLRDVYDKNAEKVKKLDEAYEVAVKNAEKYREENEKLSVSIAKNKSELEDMESAGKNTSEAYKKLAEDTADLEKSYTANEKQINSSTRNALNFSTQANETRAEMEKLQRTIDETSVHLEEAINSSDGYAHSMDEVGDSADSMSGKISAAFDAAASAIAAAGIERAFDSVKQLILDCTDASIEFESAITGVFKTVDGTTEQLQGITQGIKNLSTSIPVSTTEIAGVAEAAGQLGIRTEDILNFTEVMIEMGTATNLSSEEAASQLAKLTNITEMSADDYERLGSAIVDLGNHFATTEADIVNMVMRMASSGDMVGLSVDDMLAYATALSSVGIEAEAGGSAISKLFKKLESAVAESRELMSGADYISGTATPIQKYAEVAGMLAEDFSALWENDPAEALREFLAGLGELDKKGGNAIVTLEDMGLTEIRLSNAILALSGAGGLLNEALETSEDAWKQNTALAEEAAKRYSTTESKIQLLKNQTDLLKISIGDDLMTAVNPAIAKLTEFTSSLGDAAEESPALSSALAGIGGGLAGLTGLTATAAGIKAISAALGLFGSAAGPVALTVSAVTAAASAISVYVSNSTELSDAASEFIGVNDLVLGSVDKTRDTYADSSKAIEENRSSVEKLIDKVISLTGEMEQTPAVKAMVESAVDELNDRLPNLGLTYDEVTGQINMTRDALIKFADEATDTAKLDALKEYLADLSGQTVQLEIRDEMTGYQIDEARQKYEEATEAVKKFTEGQTWVEQALNYTNQEFLDLKLAAAQAENELDKLTESQSEIRDALGDVNSELETAQKMYDGYISGLDDSADAASSAAGKIAEVQDGLVKKLEEYSSLSAKELSDLEESQAQRLESEEKAQAESLKNYEDYLDDLLKTHRKQQKSELKEYQKSLDAQKKALDEKLDDELDALKKVHEEKLELLDEEYMAQLKVIDEEKYNKIKELEDEIASIDALTEAEEKEIEAKDRADKLDKARQKISDAETYEERIEAREDYNELVEKYAREDLLAEREAQKDRLEALIDSIEEEYKLKEDALKDEKEQKKAALEEQFKLEEEALKSSHEEQRQILKEQLDEQLEAFKDGQSDITEAYREELSSRLEEFKTSQTEQLDALKGSFETEKAELEAQQSERVKMAEDEAQALITAYKNGLEGMSSLGVEAGGNLVRGISRGIEDLQDEIKRETARIAGRPLQLIQDEWEIHSPSRKAERLGRYFGEGLAIGLEKSAADVSSAMSTLSLDFKIDDEAEKKLARAQAEITALSLKPTGADYASYYAGLAAMNHVMDSSAVRSASLDSSERAADITIIQQLDGKVISREVSRIQWADNKITARSRGVR